MSSDQTPDSPSDSHPLRFLVPWARVESVQRHEPGVVSPGDRAVVRLEPGAMQLLETRICGTEVCLGAGYQAQFNVPFAASAAAAYELIAPRHAPGVSWTGRDVDIEWRRAAHPGEPLLAEAEVIAIDHGVCRFAIKAQTPDGQALFRGQLQLSAVRDGRAISSSIVQPGGWPAAPTPRRLPENSLLGWVEAPQSLPLGRTAPLRICLVNDGNHARLAAVHLRMPPRAGLSLDSHSDQVSLTIAPRSAETIEFAVRADRPDEVNLREPWRLEVTARAEGVEEIYTVHVAVPDPEPGRVFYLLSEDCETFDGGPLTGDYGIASVLGNANNFMDPEEYRIQMIAKPDRMNEIAERHGARWTHFWCAPQRFAVDWAAAQSGSGQWPQVASALDESIRAGSVLHEYAPHIHFDYEPDSRHAPQPRLVYDAATDGILPKDYYDPVTNPSHRYHDWDGSARGWSYVKALGDLADGDSKAGSMYKSLRYLARLQANRRYPLIARTGTFDFGASPEDQLASTEAYEANGLRGNSDARFWTGHPPRWNQFYWCDARDRMREATDASQTRLVQLAIPYETNFVDAGEVNRWFAATIETVRGSGVRILAAMTHAMLMRGEPDAFRNLEGGSFAGLDEHLGWVRSHYPDVQFATASEALVEFLDYYTPRLEAYVCPTLCAGKPREGSYVYPVRLLGRGIRIDERHPVEIAILAPPLFDAGEMERLRVTASGEVLAEITTFDAALRPGVKLTLTTRPADLRLEIIVRPAARPALAALYPASGQPLYLESREVNRPPLLRLVMPSRGRFSTDLVRLLMNPVGGAPDPLGRRLHPIGVFVMGVALTAALEMAGEERPWQPAVWRPLRLRLRWRKQVPLDGDLTAIGERVSQDGFHIRITDHSGATIAHSDVTLARDAAGWKAQQYRLQDGQDPSTSAVDEFLACLRDYQKHLDETLTMYRAQRAWRLMLWARKGYAVLFRQGLLAFLRWLPRSTSPTGQIETEELVFPHYTDFIRSKGNNQ